MGHRKNKSLKRSRKPRNPKTFKKGSRSLRGAQGWKKAAPKRGREREKMEHLCGSQCFLRPHERKFPVCGMRRSGSGEHGQPTCQIQRRGVLAALHRAKQWGYDEEAKRAEALLTRMDKLGVDHLDLKRGKDLTSLE